MMPKRPPAFTLIEMIVTIAIIGIIAAVAVPNYQAYLKRGRQMEAKSKLTQIYMIEKAFYADTYTYSSCLATMGFAVPTAQHLYTVGFPGDLSTDTQCGPADADKACNTYTYDRYGVGTATCTVGAACTPQENCFTANSTILAGATPDVGGFDLVASSFGQYASLSQSVFTALAVGNVENTSMLDPTWPSADIWVIDQNKNLIQKETP